MLRPVLGGGPAGSPWRGSRNGLTLDLEPFGTVDPPLGHAAPGGLALRISGESRHLLAVGSVLEKFLRRVHWPAPCIAAVPPLCPLSDIGSTELRHEGSSEKLAVTAFVKKGLRDPRRRLGRALREEFDHQFPLAGTERPWNRMATVANTAYNRPKGGILFAEMQHSKGFRKGAIVESPTSDYYQRLCAPARAVTREERSPGRPTEPGRGFFFAPRLAV
jgi:hypothetical protein